MWGHTAPEPSVPPPPPNTPTPYSLRMYSLFNNWGEVRMDFGWNEEQRLWRQTVRDFAQKEIGVER